MSNKFNRSKILLFFLTAIAWMFGLTPKAGRAENMTKNPKHFTQLNNPNSIEMYWDTYFEREMQTFGVHGAVMVMVQNNEVLFAKGYGYADAANQVPIDPESTILRTGSIAKTLTATAIMQLAEQGKLDLDTDVNNYLTLFKVPDTFSEPVTARQLINMTAGFDTRALGIRATSAATVQPLGEYLAEHMPPRVLSPGRYRRYNDHELALAGYLVEVISGMPYEEFVRENIFKPLQMKHSSITLPDDQLKNAARGYPVGGGANDAYPLNYYYLNTAPAAGFNATAIELAHYMISHLENGTYARDDGTVVRILEENTMQQMHATAFAYHSRIPGQANSFDEVYHNGNRYLRKLGGAPGMQNNMLLLLDQGLGFYLFVNSDGKGLRNNWTDTIEKLYLSKPKPVTVATNLELETKPDPANYAGVYREVSDQTSESTIVMVQALVNPDLWIEVSPNENGGLDVDGARHIPVQPGLFKNPAWNAYTAFELDNRGKAQFLFQYRTPYERVAWIETPTVQLGILGFSALVFLISSVSSGIALLRSNASGHGLPGLISLLNLSFLVGLALIMLPVATGGNIWQFSFEPALNLRAVLVIPFVTLALSLPLIYRAFSVDAFSITRWHSIIVLIGMAGFIYFLHTWNLLGWRF